MKHPLATLLLLSCSALCSLPGYTLTESGQNQSSNSGSSMLQMQNSSIQSQMQAQQAQEQSADMLYQQAEQPAQKITPEAPQQADYQANRRSEVFGSQLFTGAFARQETTQFNPDYAIATGDQVQVRLWGAFEFAAVLTVDPQGNIFLPHAGPIGVRGVRNQDLQKLVEQTVKKVFKANVYSYASLAAAQPVRIYVGGFVNRPGLYSGTSMDSLLHYLDQAGGINPQLGSFLDVQVRRGNEVRARVNLYDFLLQGNMPVIQLQDGDVIFTGPRQNTVRVSGLTENQRIFEFSGRQKTVADLMAMAHPKADATHVRIIRNTGSIRNTEYYPLARASEIALQNGDELEFTADKKPGTITVRVEGEHLSAQEYVLPYGARMGELLKQIRFSPEAATSALQLYRLSVKKRQKELLDASLRSLETTALTARSGTSDEAILRKEEAELILQWVERARKIEPEGQVVLARAEDLNNLLLESGDIIKVPRQDNIVLVNGEVIFPNAMAWNPELRLRDYIKGAGGFTQNANAARVLVAHIDGTFTETSGKRRILSSGAKVQPGDEILVLPKIDVKSRQIMKDLTQIIYQIAVSAKVALTI